MSELFLYGEIGPDAATKFVEKLNKIDEDQITLRINSPGGDCYEGLAMMNALRSHPAYVTAVVEGLAASAASFVAVGGADRVVMRPTAEMMAHNAMAMVAGNANEMDKFSSDLRRMSVKMASIYAEKAGTDVAEWQSAMDAETWFTADEAVAAGLADAVEDGRPDREPISAFSGAGIMAKFSGRRGSPPAALLNHPEGGERGDGMSLSKEDIVAIIRDEFQRIKAEAVSISGEVDVTYPSDVRIVPTERIKVSPNVGDKPADPVEGEEAAPVEVDPASEAVGESAAVTLAKQAGLTFTMGDVAEGFTAEVDEGGVVTITAPSGAEVGSTAEFSVLVNDTPVALSVSVRSLSDDEDNPAGDDASGQAPGGPGADNAVIPVPQALYAEYVKAYALNGERVAELDKRDREKEVDSWIAKGKFPAGLRAKAMAALENDPESARRVWGELPDGRIPRSEKGYAKAEVKDAGDPVSKEEKVAALKSRANKLAQGK